MSFVTSYSVVVEMMSTFERGEVGDFEAFLAELTEVMVTLSIEELALTQKRAQEISEELGRQKVNAGKIFDVLRLKLIPDEMEVIGATSINLKGIGRVTITTDMYAGIVSGKSWEALSWLKEHGHEDLIKEGVHPSTLKAFLKEQIIAGEEFPEEIFKVTPFDRASITKS